ncbi:MAG TPA: carboxylesterase family protein [Gemmatimonadaceae bacterium]|nr:carboxylesterase family protein [Gemmatimonadaceae bacterium]
MSRDVGLLALSVIFIGSIRANTPLQATPESLIVQTASGSVRGQLVQDVYSFKGIPFASPPVGSLRWRAPTPVDPWSGVRDASRYGPPCAQPAFDWNRAVAAESREDCLYLNVWVPRRHDGQPLPVIIFFPGGNYHGGSARGLSAIEPSYDGGRLARRGVVVVTANYRLSMFGFLAHPELTAEAPSKSSGNYALMDNIAALQWVQANIGRFGGDPHSVTAVGQSAGAWSVQMLMTSPLARGLFARAILQSGPVIGDAVGKPALHDAESAGSMFATGLGAPKVGAIAELRRRSAQELIDAMMANPSLRGAEPRGPIVDGYVLPQQPALVFRQDHEMAIPTIIGSTARDGDFENMGVSGTAKAAAAAADPARTLATRHKVAALSTAEARELSAFYASNTDLARRALSYYQDVSSTDPPYGDVITAFYTDIRMRCGSSFVARMHARVAPTWQFEFSHGYEPLGAVHLWDMQYVFGWLQAPADQGRDAGLVEEVQTYWTTFARSGNPNSVGLPNWPPIDSRDSHLDFASESTSAKAGLRKASCALYERKTLQALDALARGQTTQ